MQLTKGPGDRAPREAKWNHESNDKRHADPRLWLMCRPVVRVLTNHSSDNKVADCHADTTEDEGWPAANFVEEEHGRNDGHKLGHVHNARECKLQFVVEAKCLEQCRRIVDELSVSVCPFGSVGLIFTYRINANKLLEEHDHDADHGATNDTRLEHVHPRRDLELDFRQEIVSNERGVTAD